MHIWVNGIDATGQFRPFSGNQAPTNYVDPNGLNIAKVGYLASVNTDGTGPTPTTPKSITAANTMNGGSFGDIATWNSQLTYDQIENLYVAAATPLSGGTNNTGTPLPTVDSTADGGWGDTSKWSQGHYPTQHGGFPSPWLEPYYDVQINNNIAAGGGAAFGLDGFNTASTQAFRSDMYRLTVSSASSASLTLNPGANPADLREHVLDGCG